MTRSRLLLPLLTGSLLLIAMPAFADAPKLDRGDTAWMLTSTALVLMMTVPGLALFYAGMVRKMNLLNTMAQSFGVTPQPAPPPQGGRRRLRRRASTSPRAIGQKRKTLPAPLLN